MKKTFVGLFVTGILLGQPTGQQELLSVADVEKMLAAQVPSEVIVLKVKQAHTPFNLSTTDILAL